MKVPLACSVRGCGLALACHERAWVCSRGHAYDVARSGYVNLLQPQDRRSRHAGDSKAAVEARARLLATGIGREILERFVTRAAELSPGTSAVVVDLGTGSGDALGLLAIARPISGIGIDLSTAAIDHAARRFPALVWMVANADRRLPLLDASVDLVLSFHARRNAAECARVLTSVGSLLVATPAQDDLIELRERVQGEGLERDRADQLIAEHEPFFTLADRATAREHHRLPRESLLDLLLGTYRGARASAAARVDALANLDVTLASDFFLFARHAL